MLDENNNPVIKMKELNGYQSVYGDVSNIYDNTIGATLGAVGSLHIAGKTALQLATNDKVGLSDVADIWQGNQLSMATGITDGTDDLTREIADKNNKGLASADELVYLASHSADGKSGAIGYTTNGEVVTGTDADGITGQVEGFNDKTTKIAIWMYPQE